MVGQERPPRLARSARRSPPAVAADRAVAHGDAEPEEFPADALGAPERVVARHRGDELAHFGVEPRPAEPRAGPPTPEELPGLAMPAHHGLRPHKDQVAAPVRAE